MAAGLEKKPPIKAMEHTTWAKMFRISEGTIPIPIGSSKKFMEYWSKFCIFLIPYGNIMAPANIRNIRMVIDKPLSDRGLLQKMKCSNFFMRIRIKIPI